MGKDASSKQGNLTACSCLALQSGVATFELWNEGPEMIDTGAYNISSYQFHKQHARSPSPFETKTGASAWDWLPANGREVSGSVDLG